MEIDRDSQGNAYIRENGVWRQATEQEVAAAETGSTEAFGAQVGRIGANIGDLITAGVGLVTGTPPMTDVAMQRMQARQEQFAPLTAARPDEAFLAEQAAAAPLDVLGLGVGGKMSARVAQQIAQQTARQAAREGGEQATRRLIRRPSNILGRGTVAGNMAKQLEAGVEAIPGPNLVPLAQKAINQRRTNEAFARAMGLADDTAVYARTAGVDDRVTAEVLDMFDTGYSRFKNAAQGRINQADTRALMEMAQDAGFLPLKLRKTINKPRLEAEELFQLRSQLSRVSRGEQSYLVAQSARDMLEEADRLIFEAIEKSRDTGAQAAWRQLNARYALWRETTKGRAIGVDNQINPASLDGKLMNRFGDRYRASQNVTGDDDVNAFMQTVREGAEVGAGLPSSGTTERAIAAGLLGLGGAAAL